MRYYCTVRLYCHKQDILLELFMLSLKRQGSTKKRSCQCLFNLLKSVTYILQISSLYFVSRYFIRKFRAILSFAILFGNLYQHFIDVCTPDTPKSQSFIVFPPCLNLPYRKSWNDVNMTQHRVKKKKKSNKLRNLKFQPPFLVQYQNNKHKGSLLDAYVAMTTSLISIYNTSSPPPQPYIQRKLLVFVNWEDYGNRFVKEAGGTQHVKA